MKCIHSFHQSLFLNHILTYPLKRDFEEDTVKLELEDFMKIQEKFHGSRERTVKWGLSHFVGKFSNKMAHPPPDYSFAPPWKILRDTFVIPIKI